MGVSKITHIAEQPLNFQIEYYHNVENPRLSGREQLRLSVVALWPTAAAMADRKKEEMAKAKEAEQRRRQGSSP